MKNRRTWRNAESKVQRIPQGWHCVHVRAHLSDWRRELTFGDVHGECAELLRRAGVLGEVEDLAAVQSDGVRAVVAGVLKAAGWRDLVANDALGAGDV